MRNQCHMSTKMVKNVGEVEELSTFTQTVVVSALANSVGSTSRFDIFMEHDYCLKQPTRTMVIIKTSEHPNMGKTIYLHTPNTNYIYIYIYIYITSNDITRCLRENLLICGS